MLLILAKLTATDKIDAAPFPMVYMPERFDHVQLNGFSRALILSQRGLRYSANLDCTMTLSVRGSFGVHLSFEHLDLARDTYDGESPCEDYVQFYGGEGKETILSGQHCGNIPPSIGLVTNSSTVTLRFRTNHFRERSGFRIKFYRVPLDMISDCDEMGVCSLVEDISGSGATDLQGKRSKRSSADGATNAGTSILSQTVARWTTERFMAISLSLWTTVLLARIKTCYGLQNR